MIIDPAPAPLVIVGPTASGKSALALALACRVPGAEIVSADAMAVYRGMNIGTAKPTEQERATVPHHLIDVVDPSHDYTVAEFQRDAQAALDAIATRSGVAIIVGGTGLYVRALVDGFTVPPRYPGVRAALEAELDRAAEPEVAMRAMWDRLVALDPEAAAKMLPTNRRRIMRALEVTIGSGQPFSSFGPGVDHYPPTGFRLAGLDIDRAVLDRRIDERYDRQMAQGLLAEVDSVAAAGWSRTAAQALGYKELLAFRRGQCSLEEALDEAKRRTRRFARRQQRWFRRDPRITWFHAQDLDLVDQVADWWGIPSM